MRLFSVLVVSFAATTLAAPTSLHPYGNNSLRARSIGEQSVHCSDENPALANTIGKLCGRLSGPLLIGGNIVSFSSDPEYDSDPHPAAVEIVGTCYDSDVSDLHNGPAADESDNCMSIMWQMCATSLDLHGGVAGQGVTLMRGRNNCQRWTIAGWSKEGNGFDWNNRKDVGSIIQDPATPKALVVRAMRGLSPSSAPGDSSLADTSAVPLASRDDSNHCTSSSQSLGYAIGQLCPKEGGVFLAAGESVQEVTNNGDYGRKEDWPAWVRVSSNCVKGVDVTDPCWNIMWRLCATTVDHDLEGAQLYTHVGGCKQTWTIVGNRKDDFSWKKIHDLGDWTGP